MISSERRRDRKAGRRLAETAGAVAAGMGREGKARELGALKFGRRFSGPESLLRTLLMYLSEDCSMVETVERARAGELVELSDVGLLKRVNKSGAWLGWITEQLMQQAPIAAMQCPALQGRRILAADGSVVTEPGAITSTWRLHYAMDIVRLRCQQAQVTPVKKGESLTRFAVQEGDVFLGDRGFANRRGVNHVLDHGGDVVVRMNLGSLPLTDAQGLPFAQLPHLRTLQVGQTGEWTAMMQGTKGDVAVRVCAYRKTDEQRMESERKLKKDAQRRQKQLQAETIEAAGYVGGRDDIGWSGCARRTGALPAPPAGGTGIQTVEVITGVVALEKERPGRRESLVARQIIGGLPD